MASIKQNDQFIISYFKKLDIRPANSLNQFWSIIEKKHGKQTTKELMEIVDVREDGEGKELYNAKNRSLELSLDFARYSADLYRKYFDWIISQNNFSPKRILDIGCDNGIVTCFYGLLYPNAEIVGIDQCENSIKCARELAIKLGLVNVKFNQVLLIDCKKKYPPAYFDLITSVRSMKEIVSVPISERSWNIREQDEQLRQISKQDENIQTIAYLLQERNGRFLSFERLTGIDEYIWWRSALFDAGLNIYLNESTKIIFHETGEMQTFPLFVAYHDGEDRLSLDDIILFFKGSNQNEVTLGEEYYGLEAELIFYNFTDKQLISGIQIDYKDGSGNMRIEAWTLDSYILAYQYSNIGYRKIKVAPLKMKSILLEDIQQISDDVLKAGQKVNVYNNISERDLLN